MSEVSDRLYERRGKIVELAKDRWPDLLARCGIPEEYLRLKKAGPCPLCGGRDRYSFTDKYGDGDYHCRHCGPGKGLKLLMEYRSLAWVQAVDELLEAMSDPEFQRLSDEQADLRAKRRQFGLSEEAKAQRQAKLQKILDGCQRVRDGDPVDLYLRNRIPGLQEIPGILKFHPALQYWTEKPGSNGQMEFLGEYPGMVAQVVGADGRCVNLHRTFLTPSGVKAQIFNSAGEEVPSKKVCQPLVSGGSQYIPLVRGTPGHLGVAEGIETSLAALVFAKVPCWSLISTGGMRNFVVPDWVSVLTIFADNDPKDSQGNRPGFDAAHALANREDVLSRKKAGTLRVNVRTPSKIGMDMTDLLVGVHRSAQR